MRVPLNYSVNLLVNVRINPKHSPMKIIQLTDIHLPEGGEDTKGIDIRANFKAVMDAIEQEQPDHLVLTGDLCYQAASRKIYEVIKLKLDSLDIPYSLLSGNHDDPEMLADVFKIGHLLVGEELFYKRKLGTKTALFMETSQGFVSDAQLAWLDKELSQLRGAALIFMHHPPLMAGVPYLDNNYALQNMVELQQLLFSYPNVVTVFCGHYHVEKTLCLKNLVVHITPSVCFQLDWRVASYQIEHTRPAYRVVELSGNGSVRSTVVYV